MSGEYVISANGEKKIDDIFVGNIDVLEGGKCEAEKVVDINNVFCYENSYLCLSNAKSVGYIILRPHSILRAPNLEIAEGMLLQTGVSLPSLRSIGNICIFSSEYYYFPNINYVYSISLQGGPDVIIPKIKWCKNIEIRKGTLWAKSLTLVESISVHEDAKIIAPVRYVDNLNILGVPSSADGNFLETIEEVGALHVYAVNEYEPIVLQVLKKVHTVILEDGAYVECPMLERAHVVHIDGNAEFKTKGAVLEWKTANGK